MVEAIYTINTWYLCTKNTGKLVVNTGKIQGKHGEFNLNSNVATLNDDKCLAKIRWYVLELK